MISNTIVGIIIFTGSAIMLLNIILYIRFERRFTKEWGWEKAKSGLYLPIVLLILFFIGYLAVGFSGAYNLVVAGILFGGSVFVLVMLRLLQLLSDRIRHTEQLRIDLKAAEKASEAKSTFLSNMSHDIRTPLNAIIGYARMAEDEETTEEELKEYLEKIGVSGQQLLELVNDILEMSRIENGKMHLAEEADDIVQIVEDMHVMFDDQMRSKNLQFVTDTSGVKNRFVMCDRVRMNRILINLISNAYKFTPEGGRIDVRLVEKSGETGADEYELRVKDTGIGMTEEFASHVFDSFERERSSTVSGIQGTGLGMAITKNLVDLMGGTIEVETEVNKGTEFIVRLQLDKAEKKGVTEPDTICPEECACGKRVLLAEDVEINREIATHLLESMGLCVDTASNGKEVVDAMRCSEPGHYDAILMDIQMPVMDGYEAAKAIRDIPDPDLSSIPIIAVTANAFAEDRQRAIDAGMNGHVAKPMDPSELKKELSRVLH
jgi:Signal transduction histidine kinase